MTLEPLSLAACAIVLLLLTACSASLYRENRRLMIMFSFALASVASLLATAAGIWTVGSEMTAKGILLIGLPDLPFHVRFDPLSGYFFTVIGLLALFVSVYSIGYVQGIPANRPVTSLIIFIVFFWPACSWSFLPTMRSFFW